MYGTQIIVPLSAAMSEISANEYPKMQSGPWKYKPLDILPGMEIMNADALCATTKTASTSGKFIIAPHFQPIPDSKRLTAHSIAGQLLHPPSHFFLSRYK